MEGVDRLSNLPHHIIYHLLSLTDTKYAVQTSVLSKEWRYHWIHIHSLNFDFPTFTDFTSFKKFVLDVLQRRQPLNLSTLRFHLKDTSNESLVKTISDYATSHGVEELETNSIATFPASLFECQTLRTLKLGPCIVTNSFSDLFGCFVSLTTLKLYKVWFTNIKNYNDSDHDVFASFPNLENLCLIKCNVSTASKKSFNISLPLLVCLTISHLEFQGLWFVISAPKLKTINLKGTHPLVLFMNKCQTPEKVKIDLFPPMIPKDTELDDRIKSYISHLNHMAKGLYHSKSIRVSLAFSTGKFLLYLNNRDDDVEMQYEELKVSEEDWLSFALPMVRGFGLKQLATILEDEIS